MSKYSGDLVEIGIGKESSRGTAVVPSYGWKWSGLSVVDKAIMSLDEGRRGVLEDSLNSYVAGTYAEGSIEGPVRDQLIGLILLAFFGQASDSTVQTGVYDHAFTVSQSNNHPSLTINKREPNAAFDHALAMLDSLEITCVPDSINIFSAGFRSKARAAIAAAVGETTITIATPAVLTKATHGLYTGDVITLSTTIALPTGLTAGTQYYVIKNDSNTFWLATTLANALAGTKIATSGTQSGVHTTNLVFRYSQYATSENIFIGGKHTTLKLASTQSDLTGASAINVRSAKFTGKKNIEDDRTIGSLAPADIVNRMIEVELEVEVVVTDQTHFTSLLAGTSQAVRLDMNNTDVTIGASSNPRLYIDLYKANLQDASPKYERGGLTLQTLQFKAHYHETSLAMIAATLRNTVASY